MNRSVINLILFGLCLFSASLEFTLAQHNPKKNLKTRAPDNNDPTNGISKPCQTYYSATTPHAVCNGDRSMMCLAGCTGGVVAQNCQLNASSPLTTETCSVAFSQTSETAYLCNTPQGAYTCQGPHSGGVVCHNCVSTPNGVLPSNITSSSSTPGHSSSNSTSEHDSQDTSSDSSRMLHSTTMALPGLISLFTTAAFATLL